MNYFDIPHAARVFSQKKILLQKPTKKHQQALSFKRNFIVLACERMARNNFLIGPFLDTFSLFSSLKKFTQSNCCIKIC